MATTKETVTTLGGADQSIDLQALIREQVAAELERVKRESASAPVVLAETRSAPAYEPPKYLKHYRCDTSPDLTIVRVNMSDGKPNGAMKGKYIKFRRGHFFATEQGEVDQLEWMRQTPPFDPLEPGKVLGGNPSIYEADGKELTPCEHCGELFVAGSNAWKSHLRASHGIY